MRSNYRTVARVAQSISRIGQSPISATALEDLLLLRSGSTKPGQRVLSTAPTPTVRLHVQLAMEGVREARKIRCE